MNPQSNSNLNNDTLETDKLIERSKKNTSTYK